MSALAPDPAYRRRIQRAIEVALTNAYGREGYLRLLREAERRDTPAAEIQSTAVVDRGAWGHREMGESTHDADV